MKTGVVKWFNNTKGFGFILPDGGEEELFVHYTSIVSEGFKTLEEGAKVSYEVADGQKGPAAVNVKIEA